MTQFVDTPTDMVRVVQNAIEGYAMGAVRALAQEPVQNALDAAVGRRVHVAYRLLQRQNRSGEHCRLLTVTDRGTSGLKGPILSAADRNRRGNELADGENWAAFEGQGFTRKEGDALGSRGQGKSAFLYHSHPPGERSRRRFMMLYDSLLPEGEYRFGVRCAMPADQVMEPPWLGDRARQGVTGHYEEIDGLSVPLELDPLTEPGTRVVIPYLTDRAATAIESGELERWLERCWWRAIQSGRLHLTLDVGRGPRRIGPPGWWDPAPWQSGDARALVRENVQITSEQQITRLVLYHDQRLRADEIDGYDAQYSGIQLLRGDQWIETHDIRDIVPPGQRAGFRGFCEFNPELERALHSAESPQHDRFDGRRRAVRQMRETIDSVLREFAESRGWIGGLEARDAPEVEKSIASQFLIAFAAGAGAGRPVGRVGVDETGVSEQLDWTCKLEFAFPDRTVARVDWGQKLSGVGVRVNCDPVPDSDRFVAVELELLRPGREGATPVDSRVNVRVVEGESRIEFWDLDVVCGPAAPATIAAPEPGRWLLRARVTYAGALVATASRRFFVEADPPAPAFKPQTVSVTARNLSTKRAGRIDDGDIARFQVSATNRETVGVNLRVDAFLDDRQLLDKQFHFLKGLPAGDRAQPQVLAIRDLLVNATNRGAGPGEVSLDPGRHTFRAEVFGASTDEPLARASCPVWIETDPGREPVSLPFQLEANDEPSPVAMWRLDEGPPDHWTLRYSSQHPIYQNLKNMQPDAGRLSGQNSFIAEVCANGLLEWALEPVSERDLGRVEQLLASRPPGIGLERWENYCERIDQLAENYMSEREEDFGRYMERWRECVAFMLDMFADID